MNTLDFSSFPEQLRDQVPGFDTIYYEHLHDYDEVLPHVLVGDLVRFLSEEVYCHGSNSTALRPAMSLLERAMSSADPKLQELVVVSFLENLDPEDTAFSTISELFGPNLEEKYRTYKKLLEP
jgi:hypothetical protein